MIWRAGTLMHLIVRIHAATVREHTESLITTPRYIIKYYKKLQSNDVNKEGGTYKRN
jgi:hypothetical protein